VRVGKIGQTQLIFLRKGVALNFNIETLFWAIARFFVIEVNNDLCIVRQLRVLMRWKTDYFV